MEKKLYIGYEFIMRPSIDVFATNATVRVKMPKDGGLKIDVFQLKERATFDEALEEAIEAANSVLEDKYRVNPHRASVHYEECVLRGVYSGDAIQATDDELEQITTDLENAGHYVVYLF